MTNKMEALNELMKRGYNICFILDRLVNDYMTNAEFVDFADTTMRLFPDPHDTTQTYAQKPKETSPPCRILRLISKP